MELINRNVDRKQFVKWYFRRKEIQRLFGLSLGFCLLGVAFFLIGVWIHNTRLYDVLFLMIGIGLTFLSLLIISPFVAFKKNFGKRIEFARNEIGVHSHNNNSINYPIKKIRVIYLLKDQVVIELKGISSISAYRPDASSVQNMVSSLENTGIRIIEADSFFHIMVRKGRSRIL